MKLLFKHLWRTFKRAPWQPLLIILTVVLAVGTGVVAFRLSEVFFVRAEAIADEETALGDITVTASSDRAVGFLVSSDAEELVGSRGRVFGDMVLVGRAKECEEGSLVAVSAGDFEAADRYFEFNFYEYGRFTSENIDRCAAISKKFSEKHELCVGDTLEIEILGQDLRFDVEAVVESEGLFADTDVLISLGSLRRLLAEKSSFIASLGDCFTPCNRILIKCDDDAKAESIVESLRQSEAFEDCIIEDGNDRGDNVTAIFQTVAVTYLMFLVLVVSCILIMTSQALIRRQRDLEYAQFAAVGASQGILLSLSLGENIIYAAIGALGGVLLSPYALAYVLGLFKWERYSVSVGAVGVIFGFVLAIVLSASSTLIAWRRERKIESALMLAEADHPVSMPNVRRETAVFGILLAVFASCLLISPTRYDIVFATLAVISLTIFVYYLFLPLLRRGIRALLLLLKGRFPLLCTALKLTGNDYGICHVGRLMCVLCSLLISILACMGTLVGQHRLFSSVADGDIITINMSDKLSHEIAELDEVSRVVKFGIDTDALINGEYSTVAVYATCYGDNRELSDMMPDELPDGDGIILSEGLASLIGARVGDGISLRINGNDYSFTLEGTKRISMSVVYVNAESIDDRSVMHSIKLVDDGGGFMPLSSRLDSEGVLRADPYDVNGRISETFSGFISLSQITSIAALVIASVGCCNIFLSGRRADRHNVELLALCGADKRTLKKIGVIRIALVLVFALVIGCLAGAITVTLLDAGIRSFGFMMV